VSKIICVFIAAFAIALLIGAPYIALMKKIKARQTILCYVEQHKDKQGIPTMGGVIFLVAASVASLIFWSGEKKLAVVALVVTLVYGGIGALDDGIKIVLRRNLGLRAYQKIISQAAVAAIMTYFAYKNPYIGTEIAVPFISRTHDIGWWYIPLAFTAYIAATNCVNLTDGLDGLAGTTVALYLAAIFALITVIYLEKESLGQTFYAQELYNLMIFAAALSGGVVGFLWYNSHKAKIFMGDTGSLALGGACAVLPMMIKNPLAILFVGIMFAVSGISVIVQVLVYKLKKKRVFLMAPFHHHLEMKGYNESKIVSYYGIITAVAGMASIIVFS
jgi:phospho-N-acetylmuramoyl-pentapeptide-transferase